MHNTSRHARSTAALSACGGTLWIIGGMLGGAGGSWTPAASVLVLAALPLLAAALLGLAAQILARSGVPWRLVHGLALGGAGLAAAALLADLLAGMGAVPLFGLGSFLLSAALIMLGGSALQRAGGAGWEGLLVLIGLVGMFLPVGAGVAGAAGLAAWTVWGCGWICAGNVLWQVSAARGQHFTAVERTRN